MDRTCNTCHWWESFDEDEPDSEGWCHRYPPSHMSDAVMVQLGADPGFYVREYENNRFPITDPGSFCGEHQPKQ